VRSSIDDVAARRAPDDPPSARLQALGLFALMVATVQVARALADQRLADAVLEQGIDRALALLGVDAPRLTRTSRA
jgi:TetR/AcrR family transcriptional repressor of nem operon